MSELVISREIKIQNIIVPLLALTVGISLGVMVATNFTVAAVCVFLFVSSVLIFSDLNMGLILIAFFLPFQKLFTLEISGYTLKTSQILTIITILAWIVYSVRKKDFRIASTPMNLPLVLFLGANLLSMINAINLVRSAAIFSWALFSVLLFILLASLAKNEDSIRKIVASLLISGTIVSLFGIYQFVGSYLGLPTLLRDVYLPTGMYLTRVQSTFLEPLHFASFLLVTIPVCLALYFAKVKEFNPAFLFSALLVMVIAMILTIARGGYLGLLASAFAVFLFSRGGRRKKGNLLKVLLPFAAVVIVLGALVLYIAPPGIVSTTIFGGTAIRGGSSFTRMLLIKDAWSMFLESPVFGVGIGNYGPYVNQKVFRSIINVVDFGTVNNVPMEVLAESGILGFLALGLVFFGFLKGTWKGLNKANSPLLSALLIGLIASFFGLSVQYLTYSPFYGEWTWFMLGLSMAAANLTGRKTPLTRM